MLIEEAMKALGVTERSLSPDDRAALDARGFVVLPHVILPRVLADMRAMFERLMKQEGKPPLLSELFNKGECFDGSYTHPKILAAVHHLVRRDFKLASLTARDGGHDPTPPGIVTVLGMIDDFTEENGAPHFGTAPLVGAAGTVVVFDSRAAARPAENRSMRKRRTLVAAYAARDSSSKPRILPQTLARLSPAARFIVDA